MKIKVILSDGSFLKLEGFPFVMSTGVLIINKSISQVIDNMVAGFSPGVWDSFIIEKDVNST